MECVEYVVPPAVLNKSRGTNAPIAWRDDTYQIPIKWLEANARRFHFTDEQIIAAATDQVEEKEYRIAGIYFLVVDGCIVYVGMSNDIERRIFTHRKNGNRFDAVAWFETPLEYIRDVEAYYIRRIKPLWNDKYPIDSSYSRFAEAFDK